MNILIWTNCQGEFVFNNWLAKLPYFKNSIVSIFSNYIPIEDDEIDVFKTCDLIIYQPTKSNYKYIPFLKPDCIKICIPVAYADMFCLYGESDKYVGGSTLEKYKDFTLEEILDLYDNNKYDFELKERFEKSMMYLIEKEKQCDIKISNLILNNYKNVRLFDTQNHPNGIIGSYIAKEICKLLKIEGLDIDIMTQGNIHITFLQWEDSFYAKRELDLKFIEKDNKSHYRLLLIEIYNNPTLIKKKYNTPQ